MEQVEREHWMLWMRKSGRSAMHCLQLVSVQMEAWKTSRFTSAHQE